MPNFEDKLKKLDEHLGHLKARKQALINREKQKERKERTRRLIQNGVLAEKFSKVMALLPTNFRRF
jgi:hypothetical protein